MSEAHLPTTDQVLLRHFDWMFRSMTFIDIRYPILYILRWNKIMVGSFVLIYRDDYFTFLSQRASNERRSLGLTPSLRSPTLLRAAGMMESNCEL